MSAALWVAQVALALLFLAAGAAKLSKPRDELSAMGLGFVEDFSDAAVRSIGLLEVLGGIGLILPAATGIAPILTPLAAAGLALTMVGAAVVHYRRDERADIVKNVVIVGVAGFVVFGRFGPWGF